MWGCEISKLILPTKREKNSLELELRQKLARFQDYNFLKKFWAILLQVVYFISFALKLTIRPTKVFFSSFRFDFLFYQHIRVRLFPFAKYVSEKYVRTFCLPDQTLIDIKKNKYALKWQHIPDH